MSAHVRFTSHMEFWSAARLWQLFKLSGTPHPTLACMIDCWQFPSEEAGVLVAGAVLTESFQSAISVIETWILVIFAGLENTEDTVRQNIFFFFFYNNLGGADHYSVRFDTKNVGIFFHVPEFRKSIFTNLMIFIFHLYWLFCPWKFVSSSLISFPRCINMFHLLVFVLSEVTELISLFLKIFPQLFRTKFNS